MAWFGRNREDLAAEATLIQGFYEASLAAADSYEVAMNRVEEGDVYTLFGKIRRSHLDYADDLRKRLKKLGGDPQERSSVAEGSARVFTRIQSAGSVRDLLISMRQGEESGVAMCREALEEADLSGKSSSIIESYNRTHIDNIRDLSEQIALRSTYAETTASFAGPQWLRYPKAGFWLLQGGVALLGYLFGRGSGKSSGGSLSSYDQGRTSPRAELGGTLASEQYGDTIGREIGQ